ncbi:hypothetical protein PMAYCL1PPCAC_13361, partial [Pristionchus mayeri]
ANASVIDCTKLHPYQFQCQYYVLTDGTEQPIHCNPDNTVSVQCMIDLPGYVCEGSTINFTYNLPDGCRFGSKTNHATTMLLSLFFGLLGLDRFYPGYYTIG